MIKPLFCLSSLLLLSACVHHTKQTTTLPSTANISHLGVEQSAIVIYRLSGGSSQAINVSINGELLASLSPNAKTQTTLCARPIALTALYSGQDIAYLSKLGQQGYRVATNAGDTAYIRLDSIAGHEFPQVNLVEPATAQAEIGTISKASNTLSRLSPSITCQHH